MTPDEVRAGVEKLTRIERLAVEEAVGLALGISRTTVLTLERRALGKLRRALGRRGR